MTQLPLASDPYQSLLQVSEAIALHSDLPALIKDLAGRLPRMIPVNFLGVSLYDAERGVMRLHTLQANVPADIIGGHEEPIASVPAGLVWETQQPLIIRDLAEEYRWPSVLRLMQEDGVRSSCLVPLTTATRKLGALTFSSRQVDAFHDGDLALVQQVGRQVAVAIESVLNREAASLSKREVERQRDRFGVLLRMTNAMVSKLDLRELLQAVSTIMREVVPQQYVSLILCDEATHTGRLLALDSPDHPGLLPDGYAVDLADSSVERALRTKQPVLVNRLDEMQRYGHEVPRLLVSKGFQSMCSLPLLSRGRAIGCLNLAARREQAFPESEIEFLTEVAGQITMAMQNALAYQEITQLKNKLSEEKLYLEEEIRSEQRFDDIIGDSPALARVLAQVEVVAPTDSTVLILGETGTGKELIARAVHRLSGRSDRTFVKLNCAAIPSGLLESELFGHERGAFTGAISQKLGRFELANGGTIFLDEVGEIPLELQSKLLRVLQEQEFERLGSTRTIKVNVRLIAATNRDLAALMERQAFRSDLYYRLNVFPVTLPPLRERREDIPMLARYFTQHYAARMKKTIESISGTTMEALRRYRWPGNIRELENLIERAVILTQGHELHVPIAELKLTDEPARVSPRAAFTATVTLLDTECQQILRVLRETKWVIGGADGAAVRLGLKRTTLTSKMKKLGLSRPVG